jgi:hypothetical protein
MADETGKKHGRGGNPDSVYVRSVVKKWHWDRPFSQYFYLPLSVSFHQYSRLTLILTLL